MKNNQYALSTMEKRPSCSPTGWWIAGILERHVFDGKTIFWNNYRLIRASHWRDAYRAAVILAKDSSEISHRVIGGICEFVGISDLVPIYDAFEHGSEVLWEEYDDADCESSGLPIGIYSESELDEIYQE
jgi:hypothetical protein